MAFILELALERRGEGPLATPLFGGKKNENWKSKKKWEIIPSAMALTLSFVSVTATISSKWTRGHACRRAIMTKHVPGTYCSLGEMGNAPHRTFQRFVSFFLSFFPSPPTVLYLSCALQQPPLPCWPRHVEDAPKNRVPGTEIGVFVDEAKRACVCACARQSNDDALRRDGRGPRNEGRED